MLRWVKKNACVKNVTNLISASTEIYGMMTLYSVGFCGKGDLGGITDGLLPVGTRLAQPKCPVCHALHQEQEKMSKPQNLYLSLVTLIS